MYSLLLVDDEPLALEYLSSCLDYATLGLRIVGTCSNGNDGLEQIFLNEPDIVMMDIKMPGMTGIEVLEAIRNFDNKPEIVFVTGHSDFVYMQKALQYGADNYILKPVNESDLMDALRNAIHKVEKKVQIREEQRQLVNSLKEMQFSYEYYMLKNYLLGFPDQPTDDVTTAVSHSRQAGYYQVLALSCIYKAGYSTKFIFDTVSDLIISSQVQIFENNGFFAIVIQMGTPAISKDCVTALSRKIEETLANRYGIELSGGAGEVCNHIRGIHTSYLQAQRVLLYRAFLNNPYIIFFDETDLSEVMLISNVKKSLYEYLKVSDGESVNSYLQQIFSHLESIEHSQVIRSCADFWGEIILELNNQLAQSANVKPLSVYDLSEMIRMINLAPSILGVYEVIKTVLTLMVSQNCANQSQSLSRAIQNAVCYIDSNCSEDITLNDVARHVYLSNSRFSTVFSEEVGETFSRYLTRKRIEKAKELMQNPYAKIYEISEMSGFKDARYFSTVFRKLEGITPAQFMRQIQ